jgi:hypothetical protein
MPVAEESVAEAPAPVDTLASKVETLSRILGSQPRLGLDVDRVVGHTAHLRVTNSFIGVGELRSKLLSLLHQHQQELLPQIQSVTVEN